ncbi:MAG TPA: hypothetical protein VF502_14415 [Stellaceae bacterium]
MAMDIEGLRPTVHVDAGKDGRIVVADSLSYFEHQPWTNDVAVGASFAGAPTAAMAMRQGVKAWIGHEGGPGKDDAGISGLAFAQRFGVPAAAIATKEARLSGGMSLLTGHVSRANEAAMALGVRPGQTGEQAARLMLKAPPGRLRNFPGLIDEAVHEMVSTPEGKIYACWSFSRAEGAHPHDVFCVASHGAKVMALYALRIRPKGVICNDAGRGLDDSGIEGLAVLDEHGIAAAAVSTESARIGDALSTYHDGVISAANAVAKAKGVKVGMRASDAAKSMLS